MMGKMLLTVGKELLPIWIFFIEYFFLLFCECMGIIGKKIKNFLFVEGKKKLTNLIYGIHPIDFICGVFFVEIIFSFHVLYCFLQNYKILFMFTSKCTKIRNNPCSSIVISNWEWEVECDIISNNRYG